MSEQRLEVVTVKLSPLTVDVSILPTSLNLNVHMVSIVKLSCQGKIRKFVTNVSNHGKIREFD